MSIITPHEVDEVETSRAEKLLAVGLVVFLLVGGFWVMDRLGSLPSRPDYGAIAAAEGLPGVQPAFEQASSDYQRAVLATEEARRAMDEARADYEFKREEYRVALERGVDDPELAEAHAAARTAFEKARLRFEVADAARATLERRLDESRAAYDEVLRRVDQAMKAAQDRYQLIVFALRFGYAMPLFGLSVWAWFAVRRRSNRHLLLATAFMGFAGIQAVGLVGQYGWYLLRDIGPIALSLTGSAVCVAGLVALRRWAQSSRRVYTARLRRRQCPYCGFPLGDGVAYCSGCGRRLGAPCPHCGGENVPESLYCRHCGQALGAAAPGREGPVTSPARGPRSGGSPGGKP